MDICCTTCGEPWDVFSAYEMVRAGELTLERGVPKACPACKGVVPPGQTPEQREHLDLIAEAARLMPGDLDGLACAIEDLEVMGW